MRALIGLAGAFLCLALGADAEELSFDGPNAFRLAWEGINTAERAGFNYGSGLFHYHWDPLPDTAGRLRGLGPIYAADSCESCHIRDGRGIPPAERDTELGGLVLALGGEGGHAEYGVQVQHHAIEGAVPEMRVEVRWIEATVPGDPEAATHLRRPVFTLLNADGAPLAEVPQIAPRLAPQLIGLGRLAEIPVTALAALADPNDADGDGISGRLRWVVPEGADEALPGRFGWKAGIATVAQQTAFAATYDIGLTVPGLALAAGDCTEVQTDCREMVSMQLQAADYDMDANQLRLLTFYTANLAVPPRRIGDAEAVARGEAVFVRTGCAACHVAIHVTADGDEIAPYTDLLLHDMGTGLADEFGSSGAEAGEWRTPPLWGIGRTEEVSGGAYFLHDGRARGLGEAILWHWGEAAVAQTNYRHLPADERDALLDFLNSL